jgi:hypothetical protein
MALMRWPGGGRREPASGWASHERRAGDLVTEFQSLARTGILSKAVLLAADDKITDETILQQLRQRPGRIP